MRRIIIAVFLMLFILLAIFFIVDAVTMKLQFESCSNTVQLSNIDAFIKESVDCFGVFEFQQNDEIYYLWIGKQPWYVRVHSGGPYYIFNRNGILVDWTVDSGEASIFLEKWDGIANKKPCSIP